MSNDSFKVKKSLNIKPNSASTSEAGDVRFDSSDSNRMKVHDGTDERVVQTSVGNLDANKAVTTDADSNLASSATTATELGYVSGVTSSIQTQLNGKQATGNYITALTGDVTASGPGSASSTISAGAVTDSKVASNAAISRSKIAVGTANRVVVNDGSTGDLSEATYSQVATSMGAVTGVGTIDSEGTPSSNALTVSGNNVIAQSASATAPGVVNTTTQSFAGAKTFNTSVASAIYKGTSLNPASSGTIRLSNGEGVSWRNSTNTTDISFGLNASDQMSVQADLNVNGHKIVNTGSLTLPTSTDTLVGRATTDTLTNKTISGSSNTITNVSLSSGVTGTLPIANGGTGQVTANDALNALLPTQTGNASKFLKTDGTNTSWGSVSAVTAFNVVSKTSTYTAAANDHILASSSSFTITLPTAVGISGQQILIQHAGTNLTQIYTLNTTSAQTIGGIASGSYALYTNGEVVHLISDGANWQILSHIANTDWIDGGTTGITATSAYTFTIPSSSITAGTVYTNNGQTFYVTTTTSSSTTLTCYGTGSPTSSGTLTFVSGSPSGNLSFSASTTTGAPVKGTASRDKALWRRVGRHMLVELQYYQPTNTSAVAGSGKYLYRIPASQSMDISVIGNYTGTSVTGGNYVNVGSCYIFNSGTVGVGGVSVHDSNYIALVASSNTGNTVNFVGSSYYSYVDTAIVHSASFSVPISGWQP